MDKDILANLMRRFPMKEMPNGTIRTPPVRLSFPHLGKPRADDRGNDKFEATLLFPLGADLTILNKAVEKAVIEKFGDKAMALVQAGSIDWPIKDQGKRLNAQTGELWEGMVPGAKVCAARTTVKPRIMDRNASEIDGDAIYPGCWCLVTVHAWAGEFREDGAVKKRFGSIGLNNVQLVADDERLGSGGGTNPNDEFEAIDGTVGTGFDGANGAAKGKDPYDFG